VIFLIEMIALNKISILTPAVFIACIFLSCNKDDSNIWLYYKETKCSDVWNTTENNSEDEVMNAVLLYLSNQRISVSEIEVLQKENDEGCEACHCKTGRHVRVKASECHFSRLENLGFKKE